ncbi:MAG: hypothetical protein Q9166_007010 [cf. Caloplaca sp. 2 TL-2023]
MSHSTGFGSLPKFTLFLLFTASLALILWPAAYKSSQYEPNHLSNKGFSPITVKEHETKIGIPFGHNEYAHNFTASNHQPIRHVKRAIDYDELVCRGRKLLKMIEQGPPADYVWHPEALGNGWTWKRNILGAPPEELFASLRKLGVPTDVDNVHSIFLRQDKPFMDSGGHLNTPATEGSYYNTFIPSGNTIIAESNFSPAFKAPGKKLPPLWRWSDVIWLLWTHEAGSLYNARNLKYIFRSNIVTPATRELIEYIEVVPADKLNLPFPGNAYDMNSEEGLALLATSHGQGIAYLIADHSHVLGRKVPLARIFTTNPSDLEGSDAVSSASDSSGSDNYWDQTYYYILWELRDTITG